MKERIGKILFINFFFVFTFLGFGTIELYISNNSDFWFELKDILPTIILIAAVIMLIASVILLLIPAAISNFTVAIIWGATIAFYLQGNFLPNDYGALTGEAIRWENYHMRSIINSCIWILIIGGSIFACKKFTKLFTKVIYFTSGIILATQLSTLLVLSITMDSSPKAQSVLTDEGMFEISSENNVLVFILDAFDSQLFTELLQEQPANLSSQFDDFVYYRDTVGGATRTKFAIPYILTGLPYTSDDSYKVYLQKSYSESPLLNALKSKKYDAKLYTQDAFIDMHQNDVISNIFNERPKPTSKIGLTREYLKLTAFRYMPHNFKKFFWLYSDDFSKWMGSSAERKPYKCNDSEFYKKLEHEKLKTNSENNVFRFYHLTGAHPPYTMNELCQEVEPPNTDKKRQALGSLNIVSQYLSLLKNMQIYDNSTIIVMADHGTDGIEQNPLFMIKSKGRKSPFQQSKFPFSYSQLQAILIKALNGEELDEDTIPKMDATRYFYVGQEDNNNLDVVEYAINGLAYDKKSFTPTGNIYHGNTKSGSSKFPYKLDTVLSFELDATANQYCTSGFSKNEANRTWTTGNSATMDFDISGQYSNLLLQFTCDAYAPPQRVAILANNNLIENKIITQKELVTAIIPGEYVAQGKLHLEFQTPDAISPQTLEGADLDPRVLGMSMHDICISSTSEHPPVIPQPSTEASITIDFSQNGNSDEFIVDGWWKQEKERRWSSGESSIYLLPSDNSPIILEVYGEVFSDYNAEVYVNRQCIWSGDWGKKENIKSFTIPSELISKGTPLLITFKFSNALSPSDLALSEDARELGIFVRKITLNNQ